MNKDTIAVLHALEAENDWLREQADALATALDLALFYSSTAKYVLNQLARTEAALRAYREANHA